uniref:NADH dehydrogenase subunit 3 n=1 Tax=Leptographium aureum TaxID=273775 RepID=UPI00279CF9B5|nr:NADH dehydrogenase subunit 3 [Leptographium aureum]WHN64106.1 NADH dehydrogenase subunit 3 [Leptographium aureum]
MSSMSIFFIFVIVIALLFIVINLILAPHNPYQEKYSAFECGFHSFSQSRSQFNITFFIYALVFLLLDLEILLLYPYAVSAYSNGPYGLIIVLIFTTIVTIGFVFELGKGALKIGSRQGSSMGKKNSTVIISLIGDSSSSNNVPKGRNI